MRRDRPVFMRADPGRGSKGYLGLMVVRMINGVL
jgi:hypothetical protein